MIKLDGAEIAKAYMGEQRTMGIPASEEAYRKEYPTLEDSDEHDEKHMDLVTRVHDALHAKDYASAHSMIAEHMESSKEAE